MAIQGVNVGAAPNDGTGDDPRTGISKVNSNFTDTTNMAALLAQTSPSDATSGRGLTTDSLGDNGGPIFTEASLNPNEFGGGSANLAIATGDAQTTSDVNFFMPISGLAPPTSITVVSTFTLQNMQFSTIATGLTPTLSSASGNKLLFLSISGLGGALTVGDRYYLRSDDSSSKITVNF